MNHKVGDEVLVKVRIVEDGVYGYGLKTPDGILFTLKRDNVLPLPDMTTEEAWEIARNISDMGSGKAREIFGTAHIGHIFQGNTAEEAKVKIEAWEAEKEIKVGDVVNVCGDIGVVTSFGTDGNIIHVIYSDGIVNSYRKDKDIKKTGSHIDIDWFLKQIGGDE